MTIIQFLATSSCSWAQRSVGAQRSRGPWPLLSTEAEYIASTHAAKEAIWLCTLLSKFGELQEAPMALLIDNQSAIAIAKNRVEHGYG